MKHILLLSIICVMLVGCSVDDSYQSNSTPQFIENLGSNVDSEEQARTLFTQWLNVKTDFSSSNNIESLTAKKNYYDITLLTAANINGRTDGIIGYAYYKLDSNGDLYGYYMSK